MVNMSGFNSNGILAGQGKVIDAQGNLAPTTPAQPRTVTLGNTDVVGLMGNKRYRNPEQEQRYIQAQAQAKAQANQPKGGKIICYRYWELGLLSDELHELDQAYGAWLMRTNPKWQKAYWRYARHVVKHLHRDTWKGRLLITCLTPIVKVWSQHMGHMMGGNYKKSLTGAFLMWFMVHFFMTLGDIRNTRLRIERKLSSFFKLSNWFAHD